MHLSCVAFRSLARGHRAASSHTRSGRFAAMVLILALALSTATVVSAQPSKRDMTEAASLAAQAKAFFQSKLYKEAVEHYMRAYALSKRPQPLYNTARAYEELGQTEKAVAMFRLYLGKVPVDSKGALAAKERVDKLTAESPVETPPSQPDKAPESVEATN